MTVSASRALDRRPTVALGLAVVAVGASLTFFWAYGIPPLVFAVPAGLLVRKIYRQQGTLPVRALLAAGLVFVAVVCDVTFLLINIHHLY